MDRFMGMMPSSEIEIEKRFDTGDGLTATIQAGPNGWTVIYSDSGTEFRNIEDSSENNFNSALDQLREAFEFAKEIMTGEEIPRNEECTVISEELKSKLRRMSRIDAIGEYTAFDEPEEAEAAFQNLVKDGDCSASNVAEVYEHYSGNQIIEWIDGMQLFLYTRYMQAAKLAIEGHTNASV